MTAAAQVAELRQKGRVIHNILCLILRQYQAEEKMPSRLIVVSNRIPLGAQSAGGLVVALNDALAKSGGLWVGAHPETGNGENALEEIGCKPFRRLAFRLTQNELQDYYLGLANSVLWPLFHRRPDLVRLNPDYNHAYRAVNSRIARLLAGIAGPDDLIWVHDYHLIPLAEELRKLGLHNRIGFFLHIPFPVLADLTVLPEPDTFADNLAHYNLIGLQTRGDVARCLEMFRADPRAEFMTDGTVKFRDRVTSVRSFPIGIDVEAFQADAEREAANPFGSEQANNFIIGVDRLDYSKGIPNRFRAFGRYLETRPQGTRACLVQIAPPSRQDVQAYQDIRRELEEIAGRINGQFAELDWTPIRYIHRSIDRTKLALLYRLARACLITSLADGMNLVSKEYVAAQDPSDPGVLILSRFAGAAEDMTDALLINPYDTEAVAQAIGEALQMPLEERKRRYAGCFEVAQRTNASIWSTNFLHSLATCVPTLELATDERPVFEWSSTDGSKK